MALTDLFTPDQLAAIQELMRQNALGPAVGLSQDGRSPFKPRQLQDLTRRPAATDPRPLFIPSAQAPPDWEVHRQYTHPKLLWHAETHEEVCAKTTTDETILKGKGYTLETKPIDVELDPVAALEAELATWTEDDRQEFFETQRKLRMTRVHEQLAKLNDAQLERVTGQSATQVKRGPGRPRKVAV